jgi:hypothetical protein
MKNTNRFWSAYLPEIESGDEAEAFWENRTADLAAAKIVVHVGFLKGTLKQKPKDGWGTEGPFRFPTYAELEAFRLGLATLDEGGELYDLFAEPQVYRNGVYRPAAQKD